MIFWNGQEERQKLLVEKSVNGELKRIDINKCFREPIGNEKGPWVLISEEEYMQRKQNRIVKGE